MGTILSSVKVLVISKSLSCLEKVQERIYYITHPVRWKPFELTDEQNQTYQELSEYFSDLGQQGFEPLTILVKETLLTCPVPIFLKSLNC